MAAGGKTKVKYTIHAIIENSKIKYMIEISLWKIKNGKKNKIQAWFKELETIRRTEAIETLKQEKISFEMGGIIKINNESYCLIAVASKKEALASDKTKEINLKHREIKKECLELDSRIDVPRIYDLP